MERDVAEGAGSDTQKISTHTLTWSVTKLAKQVADDLKISTHTLTWSVTDKIFIYQLLEVFQLTRSRGA